MNEQQTPSRPVAYSYVRFSTTQQVLGDSLRRQVDMAKRYCEKYGLDLHPVSYRDLGVSAFKRKNIERGALAAFIAAVKQGIIAKGSFLVIEQFDRLSRAEVDVALRLLLDLVHSGVTLVTLDDEKIWDREAVQDVTNLIVAILMMSRANNESSTKSLRLREAWGEKKRNAAMDGTVLTSECPRWLSVSEDKKSFVVLQDRVESIQKVFAMRIGGYGITSIVNQANREAWPVPGKAPVRKSGESVESFAARATTMTWHTSLVGRLLQNRALLGEYQPYTNGVEEDEPRVPDGNAVLNYYPAVLDEHTFLRAQAKADRSGRFPGRRDASLKNWLQGLLRCTCGQSFVRKNKDSKAQPGYARYYCSARNRGVSDCPSANALELENAVLAVVSGVAPQFFEGSQRTEELKTKADLCELEVSTTRSTRDRFIEAIGTLATPVTALVQRLKSAQTEVDKAERALSVVLAELADLSGDYDTVFENILRAVKAVNSLDARAKLREDLSRVIERVVVHQTDGFIRVFLRSVDVPVVHPLRVDAKLPGMKNAAHNDISAGAFRD